jgi:hypothetical protein
MTRRFRVTENEPSEEKVEDCAPHAVHDIQAVNTTIVISSSVLFYAKRSPNKIHKTYFASRECDGNYNVDYDLCCYRRHTR